MDTPCRRAFPEHSFNPKYIFEGSDCRLSTEDYYTISNKDYAIDKITSRGHLANLNINVGASGHPQTYCRFFATNKLLNVFPQTFNTPETIL